MQKFITINGVEFPMPRRGLGMQVATLVDSARNANGVFVGQKIGRDQQKIDGLEWAYLSAEQWSTMLSIFDSNFIVTVRYPNMVTGDWVSRRMYVGDRSAKPFMLDEETGLPKSYIDCKFNLIDTGE